MDEKRRAASRLTDLVVFPNATTSLDVELVSDLSEGLRADEVQSEMMGLMARKGHWSTASVRQLPYMLERLGQVLFALRGGDANTSDQVQSAMEEAATRVVQRIAESKDMVAYERTIKCLSRSSFVRPQFFLSVYEYFAVESDMVTNLTFDIALLVSSKLDLISTRPIEEYPMQTVLTKFSELSFSSKSYTAKVLQTHDRIRISSERWNNKNNNSNPRATFHFPNRFLDTMSLDAAQFRTLIQYFATKPLPSGNTKVRHNRNEFLIKMLRHVRRNPEELSRELDMMTSLLLKNYAMGRKLGNTKVIDALINTRADLCHWTPIIQIVTMCPQILDRSSHDWIESGSHLPSNLLLSFAFQKNWDSVEMMVGVFESGMGTLRPTEKTFERLKDLHRKTGKSDKERIENAMDRIGTLGMRAS